MICESLKPKADFFYLYVFHPFKSIPLPDPETEEFQGDILPVLKCAARGAMLGVSVSDPWGCRRYTPEN